MPLVRSDWAQLCSVNNPVENKWKQVYKRQKSKDLVLIHFSPHVKVKKDLP